MREVTERDLSRLAKGISAALNQKVTLDELTAAVAAVQSLDDLGKDLNKSACELMVYLLARLKARKAGWTG